MVVSPRSSHAFGVLVIQHGMPTSRICRLDGFSSASGINERLLVAQRHHRVVLGIERKADQLALPKLWKKTGFEPPYLLSLNCLRGRT